MKSLRVDFRPWRSRQHVGGANGYKTSGIRVGMDSATQLGIPKELDIRKTKLEVRIMGRRSYWNAARMVADGIRLGDRSYWNLTKIPDLPSSGQEAIEELEEKGLVKSSWRDDRVEPTEAFWPWIEKQQLAETAQAIARQKGIPTPWQMLPPVPESNKPAPLPSVPTVSRRAEQPAFFDEGAPEEQTTSSTGFTAGPDAFRRILRQTSLLLEAPRGPHYVFPTSERGKRVPPPRDLRRGAPATRKTRSDQGREGTWKPPTVGHAA